MKTGVTTPDWHYPEPIQPSNALLRAAGNPLIAQILARRGLSAPAAARAFLDPIHYAPSPSSDLPDLPVAATHLRDAIQRGQRILVWGDFDVDGQTATALLVSALGELGADARSYIPHRLREGHGIKLTSLQERLAGVDLLLTCDTGVSEHEALAYAQSQGLTVLVSDHHDLPPELPPAHAVVDPKRLPPDHPLRELPGVGVAYKLIQELYRCVGQSPERADAYLDLVALGIVADVAIQTGDTRYLLQRGMQRLRQTRRVGLSALMQMAGLNPAHLDTDHIGFGLGPRLNALGRLGDANQAVELLTTNDLGRARILAAQLEGLNGRRRLLTEQIYAAAQEQIARDPDLLKSHALVLSGPRWHPGVIGIVASRLSEIYHRPAVLISAGEDGLGRGSARSVPGVDIHAAITATEHLLMGHGGHPGAAGLSLPVEKVTEFRRALSRAVDATWDRSISIGLSVDAVLPWDKLSLEMVNVLSALAPFGEGNPPVILVSQGLELVSVRVFGRDRAHRRLNARAAGITREVIWWRGAEHAPPSGPFDLAYQLKASDYRGEHSLQIEYVDARLVSAPPVVVESPPTRVVDHRAAPAPAAILAELRAAREVAVWAEGYPSGQSPGQRRDQLEPAPALVVWTPPPGPRELRAVLEYVSPQTIYLFDVPGAGADPGRFMPRLAGLVKHALRHKKGLANLEQLAAASAQRAEAVREGIHLLVARGDVRVTKEDDTTIQLAPGDGHAETELEEIQTRLRALLQETAAYRVYFARALPEHLV
ncbi:MAG: single-stranded-DNA-specific exonuclease RecJ [Anaerolineae bacterium]|jgi:single-stranded-DNA-specific exonuclease